MPKQIASTAVQADVDLLNIVDPPSKGCPAGRGVQIDIPPDWQARIALGQVVPGCTQHHIEQGGSLYVTDRAVAQLLIPAVVNSLSAPQQSQVALLNAKLAVAQIVT